MTGHSLFYCRFESVLEHGALAAVFFIVPERSIASDIGALCCGSKVYGLINSLPCCSPSPLWARVCTTIVDGLESNDKPANSRHEFQCRGYRPAIPLRRRTLHRRLTEETRDPTSFHATQLNKKQENQGGMGNMAVIPYLEMERFPYKSV